VSGFRPPKNPSYGFLEQPPVPQSAQRMVWLARAVSSVGLVIAVYVGLYWSAQGETVLAFLTLAIAVAYLLSTWINPMSPWLWISLGSLSVVLMLLDPGVVTVTMAAAVALLFLMRGRMRIAPSVASLRPVFTDTVMDGAEAYVVELTDMGWSHVGGYAFDSARISVTAAVLVHENLDRHAVITDMIFAIESRFADSRFLVTLNSDRTGLPPNYLANVVSGGSPGALALAHQQALDILATHGMTPLQLDEEAIVEEALASEVETTEWTMQNRSRGLFDFGGGTGQVDTSSVSAQRIVSWMTSDRVGQTAD